MIPHALYVYSQPSCSVIYVYINAQMVIIMIKCNIFGIINDYLMILMIILILMILIFVNSLHRDYMEMKGDEMVILPCDMQCHVFCELCMLCKDLLM